MTRSTVSFATLLPNFEDKVNGSSLSTGYLTGSVLQEDNSMPC